MKIKDLASAIGCTAGSASVAVKRLEKAGLVTRRRGEEDERVVTVMLGKKGAERLDAWRCDQMASMEAMFETLSLSERGTLRALLEKMLSADGKIPLSPTAQGEGGRG